MSACCVLWRNLLFRQNISAGHTVADQVWQHLQGYVDMQLHNQTQPKLVLRGLSVQNAHSPLIIKKIRINFPMFLLKFTVSQNFYSSAWVMSTKNSIVRSGSKFQGNADNFIEDWTSWQPKILTYTQRLNVRIQKNILTRITSLNFEYNLFPRNIASLKLL